MLQDLAAAFGDQASSNVFIPKMLFSEPYKGMSYESRGMYGVCLQKLWKERDSGLKDDKGCQYFLWTPEEIGQYMNISTETAKACMHELITAKLMRIEKGATEDRIYLLPPQNYEQKA